MNNTSFALSGLFKNPLHSIETLFHVGTQTVEFLESQGVYSSHHRAQFMTVLTNLRDGNAPPHHWDGYRRWKLFTPTHVIADLI